MSTAADSTVVPPLPDTLRLGPVHLTVSNLDRSVAYYERALGLQLHDRDGDVARLGAGDEDLLVLVEEAGAALGGRHAGLFHFALLYPTRQELAGAVNRLASTQTRLTGASDHGVSEAIYLRDPDNNGVELYADRPRDQWPPPRVEGDRVDLPTFALDMDDLMAQAEGEEVHPQAGPGLVMGHVHLHVGDIEKARAFYLDVLGFEAMGTLPTALFVSAGGYHHRLGLNTWLGTDVEPLPPHTAGLREWTVVLESADEVDAVRARVADAGLTTEERDGGFVVRDPWQTAVVFTVG
jgi:catechol 2,3-dioxygenase